MSRRKPPRDNLHTLSRHLRARKRRGTQAQADVSGVIETLALASKAIGHKVRSARIQDVIGDVGAANVHGEAQQKLDVLADDLLLDCLRQHRDVAVYGSEEREEALVLRPRSDGGRLCVLVDPLDGSSNIDVAVSVGTIFSILRNEEPDGSTAACALQPGTDQLACGYILYGSSQVLVLSTGDGVDMYVLDPVLGDFVLVEEGLRIPEERKIYSINEAYSDAFDEGLHRYLSFAHSEGYALRYVGSMVADVHRTLLKGGVFIYPATRGAPQGKLRLLYEGNPVAMLMEQAGGAAAAGSGRILDVVPEALHQRTPVIVGSPHEVELVTSRLS